MAQHSSPLQLLAAALQAVPGYEGFPEGTFPTLPILEATEFDQQHLVTTFALDGVPMPDARPLQGQFPPAVSLHLILPEGYAYWQPETGGSQYEAAAQLPENLPAPYAELLATRLAQLAAGPAPTYADAPLADYLNLLMQVAEQGWLLGRNPDPTAEKAVALQVQAYLHQLGEPALADYYQGRGRLLLAWLAAATYEPNWVEQALTAMWRTLPEWVGPTPEAVAALQAAVPVPAVLDGRACIVIALCATVATGQDEWRVYPPAAACYVAYPDLEIRWRPLRGVEHFAVFSLPHDAAGQPHLGVVPAALATPESNRPYQQLVTLLLTQKWLQPHQPVQADEMAAAQALQPYLAELWASPLAPFYELEARSLTSWLRGAL